jgi:hypothetical protein
METEEHKPYWLPTESPQIITNPAGGRKLQTYALLCQSFLAVGQAQPKQEEFP